MYSTANSLSQDDFAELRQQRDLELRHELVKMIRSHCWRKSKQHREVWNDLYSRLERDTGHTLPTDEKLDYIQDHGLLGRLFQLAAAL